jgi:hypothetical protein
MKFPILKIFRLYCGTIYKYTNYPNIYICLSAAYGHLKTQKTSKQYKTAMTLQISP